MAFFILLALLAALVTSANVPSYGGSGPYKSYYFEEETLQNYTLYQPIQSAFGKGDLKLPVIVWGNGACATEGLKFRSFLGNVASYGVLVIAVGPAYSNKTTTTTITTTNATSASIGVDDQVLVTAVDWVQKHSGIGKYAHVDGSRIGAWGQSCGGLEAYSLAYDTRVNHLGIYNSGELDGSDYVRNITKPVFYFLGGPGDVAWEHGQNDYGNLTSPKWLGNHNLGHSSAFDIPGGGPDGMAGRSLVQWLLRGDKSAKRFFTGEGAAQAGFTDIKHADLDEITVTPIK